MRTVYGFLGPNGAGKTTTMRMLVTLTEPTAGTATVAGVPVTNRPELTQHTGYLPADPPVFDELADTVGVIDDGTLVAEAPPSELKSGANESPDLETAFLEATDEREATGTEVSTAERGSDTTRRSSSHD
jgi:ABC-type multidrug transport system ATPase subunit